TDGCFGLHLESIHLTMNTGRPRTGRASNVSRSPSFQPMKNVKWRSRFGKANDGLANMIEPTEFLRDATYDPIVDDHARTARPIGLRNSP
ncbi:hypothetical protein, partial [Rhodopirellula bahusiensis]|uniref:hypothetical protein n=1 Tax=Rhodopirellula bahusiensis TaxID=2014065 RepID=UPI0032975FF2